ncbi:unnamed protein product [Mytilus coruscus]|uniref:APOL n=1 Tax=Mytilus coruscus TaxID=42192 RepID=A0A6J8ABB6_MYTCO|nr:unnamed protein product [Mytilus coruscus]
MKDLEKILLNWFERAKSVIETLEVLAEELDVHFTRISKAKIGGSAVGIVGSVVGIVGIALTPFTFGASLGLTIAGGAVAGIGGATVGGSLIADNVLSKKTKTKAEGHLSDYSNSIKTIKEKCLDMSRRLKNIKTLEDNFPDWVLFWTKFVRGQGSNSNEFKWEQTQELLNSNLDSLVSAGTFVVGEGVGSGVRIAGAAFRITGSSLRVAGGLISALMIPLDIMTIVNSAIDLHKKNNHETSRLIIQISQTLAAELPTKDNIINMTRITINSI